MLLASLTFAFMGGFAKVLSQTIPPLEVTFFRNIAGVILVGATLWKLPLKQSGGKPFLLLFRGTMGFLALLRTFILWRIFHWAKRSLTIKLHLSL